MDWVSISSQMKSLNIEIDQMRPISSFDVSNFDELKKFQLEENPKRQ